MNNIQQLFFELNQVALGNRTELLQEPSDAEWQQLYTWSNEQGLIGLCFSGIEKLSSLSLHSSPTKPPKKLLMNWMGWTMYVKTAYHKHKQVIDNLAQFYESQGIKMMLLKGYGLSLYWPNPELRPVGDIDIFLQAQEGFKFQVSGFKSLYQIAEELVYDKLGIEIECGHEHHTVFTYQGVMVENHYDFINTKAHRDAPAIEAKLKELASIISNICSVGSILEGQALELKSSTVYLPNADFNVIFLIRHLGQHFAGERVIMRQLLDWALFLQHIHIQVQEANGKVLNTNDTIHWNEIIPFLKQMGIWTFFNQINAICVDYLGIDEGAFPPIVRNEHLEKRILNDILAPEFREEKPKGDLLSVLSFKLRRWWNNRWKHSLVYDELLLPMFLTQVWSHLRRFDSIKD